MSFKNVAYNPDRHNANEHENKLIETNKLLSEELTRCGIEVVVNENLVKGEPYTNITGKFGRLIFHRAWYYWCVYGLVPIDIAEKIYAHPIGKTDVRISGHAGCVAPVRPWIKWIEINSGKEVLSNTAKIEYDDGMKRYDENTHMGKIWREEFNNHIFNDDPKSIPAQAFVDSYHIDTESGLYVFIEHIKECSDINNIINIKK